MKVSEFDYILPKSRIAQFPIKEREKSRLMVLDRRKKAIEHTLFFRIIDYLKETDIIVLNNTKVIPARLLGKKENTGGRIEVLLINKRSKDIWEVLIKPLARVSEGTRIIFGKGELVGKIIEKKPDRGVILFEYDKDFYKTLSKYGFVPLPPYIKRNYGESGYTPFYALDKRAYQTVFANQKGSVAAPTAGLHFTKRLLNNIRERGIEIITITLHIGYGTFEPIRVIKVEDHRMDKEFYNIDEFAKSRINRASRNGKRVIAVGTTSLRVLETSVNSEGGVIKPSGYTDLFIYPGYRFKLVNALLTNFHLPRSTLLMLVCAFGGKDFILRAYKEAIKKEYRFYSYGDAMLLL
ncbi:MAG TPA: tRNA preQ1(34) S-adenosylmethionine ribosyltransferase-isomerase QueA [Nitrospinota bacterium]|nr:tRNA preQ1(34) S-adenosylmethionine ribosyltransferase-isomerase QueA [Nitrospinota bacterium]